jgi:hypothetical protein
MKTRTPWIPLLIVLAFTIMWTTIVAALERILDVSGHALYSNINVGYTPWSDVVKILLIACVFGAATCLIPHWWLSLWLSEDRSATRVDESSKLSRLEDELRIRKIFDVVWSVAMVFGLVVAGAYAEYRISDPAKTRPTHVTLAPQGARAYGLSAAAILRPAGDEQYRVCAGQEGRPSVNPIRLVGVLAQDRRLDCNRADLAALRAGLRG